MRGAAPRQLLAGGNGEGTLFYPGRPDKIGGNDHIPISSLRLTLIREGNEDYECVRDQSKRQVFVRIFDLYNVGGCGSRRYMVQAAAKVGRDKVLAVTSTVMQSATEYTADPTDIMGTRQALAKLIAGEPSAP